MASAVTLPLLTVATTWRSPCACTSVEPPMSSRYAGLETMPLSARMALAV